MALRKPTLRMCAVCREMKEKSLLVRVVKNKENAIFVDTNGKAAGRGAFVCASRECIDKCKKQRALNRAFKCEVPTGIYEELLALDINTDNNLSEVKLINQNFKS